MTSVHNLWASCSIRKLFAKSEVLYCSFVHEARDILWSIYESWKWVVLYFPKKFFMNSSIIEESREMRLWSLKKIPECRAKETNVEMQDA